MIVYDFSLIMEPITEKVVEEEKIETVTQIPTEEVVEEKEKIENQSTEPDLPLTPPCPSLEDAAELSPSHACILHCFGGNWL